MFMLFGWNYISAFLKNKTSRVIIYKLFPYWRQNFSVPFYVSINKKQRAVGNKNLAFNRTLIPTEKESLICNTENLWVNFILWK